VDLIYPPRVLTQVTYNQDHGIHHDKCLELLDKLRNLGWINSIDDIRFVIITPEDRARGFNKQTFRKKDNKVEKNPHPALATMKQYVLGVDMNAAVRGKPPFGLTETSGSTSRQADNQQI
jgi:hypothetical protein